MLACWTYSKCARSFSIRSPPETTRPAATLAPPAETPVSEALIAAPEALIALHDACQLGNLSFSCGSAVRSGAVC